MAGAITRKQFLRGDFKNQHAPIRPPYAPGEMQFTEQCTSCAECINSCPENILINAPGNYPEVDFSKGECTFCFECVESCNDNILSLEEDLPPWHIKANITDQCLVFKGVHCMICREQCEADAFTFIPKVGRPPHPVLNSLLCNGCGACYQPCPNHSIKLSYQNISESKNDSCLRETAL